MNKIKEFIEALIYLPSVLKVMKMELKDKDDYCRNSKSRLPKSLTGWRPRRK